MRPFTYTRASDASEALALLTADSDTAVIAGGTNLVDLMRAGVARPRSLVDITGLGLNTLDELEDGTVRIGATMRNSDIAAHPLIRERFPLLARSILAGASGQVRNMATAGGNLLQRTRCGFFVDPSKPCNRREPGSGCPAIESDSREMAILGTSPLCIATFPGDMPVALVALDAVVHYLTNEGAASVPLGDLYRLPGDSPERENTLPTGAIITAIDIPPLSFGVRSTYRKARDRRSFAFALGAVAAALDIENGVIREARIALGSVAPVPWRARVAEESLRGAPATTSSFRSAAARELEQARPTDDNAYKVPLIERMITGVLIELAGRPT